VAGAVVAGRATGVVLLGAGGAGDADRAVADVDEASAVVVSRGVGGCAA
jgi:hypothetical protein